jgi:hypothetical protein
MSKIINVLLYFVCRYVPDKNLQDKQARGLNTLLHAIKQEFEVLQTPLCCEIICDEGEFAEVDSAIVVD